MKTVIVTGASRGIGSAVAKKFLSEGWFVIGTSTTGKINIDSENFVSIPLDLSNSESIELASQKIMEMGKEIDVLVNNAGVLHEKGNPLKIQMESLRSTLAVNVIGTIDFTEHILPIIRAGGRIINMSSQMGSFQTKDLGERSSGSYPSYRISKTALNMYTHALSGRLGKTMTVASIDPGWVRTDMGGPDGKRSPEDVALDVYDITQRDIESGLFWNEGKVRGW